MDTPALIGAGRPAVLYARAPQHNERNRTPVTAQLDACRALAVELGYTISDEATLSDDSPGTTLARPGLSALIGLVAQGKAGAIVVFTLDRLAPPESETLEPLLKELRRRAIPIYVANTPKGYHYAPATGKLLNDPAAVAAANREDWRPPEYLIIPREDEREFPFRPRRGDGHQPPGEEPGPS